MDESVLLVGSLAYDTVTSPAGSVENELGGSASKSADGTTTSGTDTTSQHSDLDYVDTNSLALNSGTIRDGAGNDATLTLPSPGATNSLSNDKALVIDTTAPNVVSFTMQPTSTSTTSTSIVTLTFTEAVTGFSSAADITVVNGTLSEMTTPDTGTNQNKVWTGIFTPNAGVSMGNLTSTLTLSSAYTDLAGNAGVTATSNAYTVDTVLPTVTTFTISDSALLAGETATVTLVFSEAVASFSNADLTV